MKKLVLFIVFLIVFTTMLTSCKWTRRLFCGSEPSDSNGDIVSESNDSSNDNDNNQSQLRPMLAFVSNGDGTCYVSEVDTRKDTKVQIPEKSPDGDTVTAIGKKAFKGCVHIVEIIIPDSVLIIGEHAFDGCIKLVNITIGNNVTQIGEYAFHGCVNIINIVISNSVKIIGEHAFDGCTKLVDITIGDNVTDIGGYAFHGCVSIVTIVISNRVEMIGSHAFDGCTNLVNITVGNKVANIGEYAFYGCVNIINIEISNSVEIIGEHAFDGCTKLVYVNIGDNVTHIGRYAFHGCISIVKIVISKSVEIIGDHAFEGCTNLGYVNIGNSVTNIGERAFYGCINIINISLTNSVKIIGASAFEGCISILRIYYNGSDAEWETLTESLPAGNDVFVNITVTYFSNDIIFTSNGDGTCLVSGIGGFTGKDLVIPSVSPKGDNVVAIENYAFYGENVKSVIIPDSVTNIGDGAFNYCHILTSITIPDSVTSIGDYAFSDCHSLISITVNDNNLYYKSIDGSLYTKDGKILIQYAIGKTNTLFTIPNGVVNIGNCAFSACYSLTDITIPDSVTSIGDYAFSDCNRLTSITITDGVTNIGDGAFNYCHSLTSITIPNGVTCIGYDAFSDCTSLTSVVIGNNVKSIGKYAFDACTNLANVFYMGIESDWAEISIGDYNANLLWAVRYYSETEPLIYGSFWHYVDGVPTMWKKASGDETVYVDGIGVISNGDGTCYVSGVEESKSVDFVVPETILGERVVGIGEYAFQYCYNLENLTLPATISFIGNYAFDLCYNLTNIYYGGTVEQWQLIDVNYEHVGLSGVNVYIDTEDARIEIEVQHNHKCSLLTVSPTCEEPGANVEWCPCGYRQVTIIVPTGHTFVNESIICEGCGKVLEGYDVEFVCPGCYSNLVDEYGICQNCGLILWEPGEEPYDE